jgi:hypothetical protein
MGGNFSLVAEFPIGRQSFWDASLPDVAREYRRERKRNQQLFETSFTDVEKFT